ncbi:MAG TPA: gamma-glutamyltransferase [Baekduia sp.]|nr:gamma-glutamyltransferase [Baekduia sp.]
MTPSQGVVAAGHPLTAAAGVEVLREGGNAVDAAIAACLASWACEPLLTGPGAGGYMLVAGAGEEPVLLDFFVSAPTHGTRCELLPVNVSFGDAFQVFNVGAASCGVYGNPAGLDAAAKRWGTLPLKRLAEPAATLAREGVQLQEAGAYIFEILEPILVSTPEARALFAPEGHGLRPGDTFRSPELAATIERFGAEGARPFYEGDIAAAVASYVTENGGTLTSADLAAYAPIARRPAEASYRGREVLTNPPPSAGGVLLALALGQLDRLASGGMPLPDQIATVMRAAEEERNHEFDAGLPTPGFLESFLANRLGSTTHISVVDGDGRACSLTCTNGEGSGLVVPGLGIHVNNVMGEEDLNPLGFFRLPAGARMPSMMAPTVVVGTDGVELVVGSAGSNRIRSAILQTIVGVVDGGLDASAAILAPRLHVENGVVYAEPGIDLDALRAGPDRVAPFRDFNLFFGGVQAVTRDPNTGALSGGGDPRRGGVAMAA